MRLKWENFWVNFMKFDNTLATLKAIYLFYIIPFYLQQAAFAMIFTYELKFACSLLRFFLTPFPLIFWLSTTSFCLWIYKPHHGSFPKHVNISLPWYYDFEKYWSQAKFLSKYIWPTKTFIFIIQLKHSLFRSDWIKRYSMSNNTTIQ